MGILYQEALFFRYKVKAFPAGTLRLAICTVQLFTMSGVCDGLSVGLVMFCFGWHDKQHRCEERERVCHARFPKASSPGNQSTKNRISSFGSKRKNESSTSCSTDNGLSAAHHAEGKANKKDKKKSNSKKKENVKC